MPRIALDVMGGDHAPHAIIEGALKVHGVDGVEVLLVGDPDLIRAFLVDQQVPQPWPEVIPAKACPEEALPPVEYLKRYPDCAISVMLATLAEGRVDGVVTAGSSGVALVASVVALGRLPGALRPGLAAQVPTQNGQVILLDVGASVDAPREHLVSLAHMGAAYGRMALGVGRPAVGVLSNGHEPHKGTPLLREVIEELESSSLHYFGPVEACDLFTTEADVLLCDGFVGNLLLKGVEGAMDFALSLMEAELLSAGVQPEIVEGAIRAARKKVDYAEQGGALLLGVQGVVVIAHGRSGSGAIARALSLAGAAATMGGRGLVESLERVLV